MDKDIQYSIKLWLQDDENAFKEIFTYYYPRLYRFAFRYLKNEVMAEDLSMEVLARIWEKKKTLRSATFENYLFTAARHRLINLWQRKVEGLLSLDTVQTGQLGNDPAIMNDHDPVLSKELETIYRSNLSALPEQRRLIFHLHRNEHLSYKEIASKLNISPKTVENQVGAALKQLRITMLQYLTLIIFIIF